MEINYIKISNYRSFNDEGIKIENPGKINLLIGTNNAGKSNILKFLSLIGDPKFSSMFRINFDQQTGIVLPFTIEDHRDFDPNNKIKITFSFNPSTPLKEKLANIEYTGEVYVTYEMKGNPENGYTLQPIESFLNELPEDRIRLYVEQNFHTSGGPFVDRLLEANNKSGLTSEVEFPKVEYLDEFRKITENKDLRTKLDKIINFDHRTQKNAQKARLLCSYFKEIFGFEVDIKIPNIENEIQLVIDGEYKPLSSLGTGYQEVLLIAFTIISSDAEIFCIDEPELHLHPRAQRSLLNLISKIDKQFYLATHSNHFLDYEVEEKTIYQITNDGNGSESTKIDNSTGVGKVINDLGIRASELYQTNGIIWVEGPSDRIYIKKWLELKYPELKEGLQFTFQYYGGKMLSHYAIDDEEYTEYLNLLLINKNCFLIMDSDLNHEYSITQLRDTKQRIIKECEDNKIKYWVTKGVETENYLTNRVLSEASGENITRNIYIHLNEYCLKYNPKKKVPFSRSIEDILTIQDLKNNEDLEDKIDLLATEITNWNK